MKLCLSVLLLDGGGGGFCMLNWLNSCSVFGGHWSVLKINLFQGHCVGLFTSTSLPVSLCSFPAAVLHCLPLPAYTYSTKTACHSKCTNVDSYFIVVCRLWRAFLLLSVPSFRTPLHPGAFKTANNHPVSLHLNSLRTNSLRMFLTYRISDRDKVEPDHIFTLTAELREEPCREEELKHLPSMCPLWKTLRSDRVEH